MVLMKTIVAWVGTDKNRFNVQMEAQYDQAILNKLGMDKLQ